MDSIVEKAALATSKGVKLEQVMVTPQMAEQWLKLNVSNRAMSEKTVKYYEDQIKKGRWKLTTDAIGFDREDRLINGQHRLQAIIKTNTPCECLVAHNLPHESFNVIDTGKTRNASDLLHVAGFEGTLVKASVSRSVMMFKKHRYMDAKQMGKGTGISNEMVLEFAQKNRKKLEDVAAILEKNKEFRALRPSLFGTMYWVFSELDRDNAVEFFTKLSTGVGLKTKDPILVLRERLINNKMAKTRYPEKDVAAWVVLAWNHYRKGGKLTKLQWSGATDNFPIPV